MSSVLFAIIGFLAGGVINALADDLPRRVRPSLPHCPRCGHVYGPAGWLATARLLRQRGSCPQCGLAARARPVVVEVGTAVLFGLLPLLVPDPRNVIWVALYSAILILVIVIDLEHRLILHAVTFPSTALALLGSLLVSDSSLPLAVVGAIVGFLFFYLLYWLGSRLFGSGALGAGDVTLAMTLGAMLGVHRILFALVLAIVLGAVVAAVLLARGRRGHFAYGPYLAAAGIVMLIWGNLVLAWYTEP